jgi:hypothetical protein
VFGRGQVNINTAPDLVLRTLGLSAAEVSDIVQTRRLSPYAAVPATFSGRGLGATTRTFRIEAEGWVANDTPTRLVAIVQKQVGARVSGPAVTVLGWGPDRGAPARRPAP